MASEDTGVSAEESATTKDAANDVILATGEHARILAAFEAAGTSAAYVVTIVFCY
jgi:hypothetical protein